MDYEVTGMTGIEIVETPVTFQYNCELKTDSEPSLRDLNDMHDALKSILFNLKNEAELLTNNLFSNGRGNSANQATIERQETLREESTKYSAMFNVINEAIKEKVSENFAKYTNQNDEDDEEDISED